MVIVQYNCRQIVVAVFGGIERDEKLVRSQSAPGEVERDALGCEGGEVLEVVALELEPEDGGDAGGMG